MAREIDVGDRVAITATVRKRIDDRAVLYVPTFNNPCSIVDRKAKAGDKLRLEGDVIFVDDETGRVTIKVLGAVTVDAGTVELVRKYKPPARKTPLRDKAD